VNRAVFRLLDKTILLFALPILCDAAATQPSYDHAVRLFQQGEYDKTISLLETVLAARPEAAAFNLLSLAYLERRRYGEALVANQRAVMLMPDNPNYLYNGSLILLGKGDSAGAEKNLRSGIARFPQSARLYEGLGEALYRRDSFAEAESWFRQAIKIDPHYGLAYVSLAKVLYAIGDRRELASAVRQSVEFEPENHFACYLYGTWLLEETDRTAEARSFLEKSLSLNPRSLDSHIRLAELEIRERQHAAAIKWYQKAIDVEPGNARLHYLLATAYRKTGQTRLAEQTLAEYRRLSH